MKLSFGAFPKEVIYYAVIPIAVLLLFGLFYWIFTHKNKDKKYYSFKLGYVYHIIGIMVSMILFSLLLGYAISTVSTIMRLELLDEFYIFTIVVCFIPLVPLITFIWLCFKIKDNFKEKAELDMTS